MVFQSPLPLSAAPRPPAVVSGAQLCFQSPLHGSSWLAHAAKQQWLNNIHHYYTQRWQYRQLLPLSPPLRPLSTVVDTMILAPGTFSSTMLPTIAPTTAPTHLSTMHKAVAIQAMVFRSPLPFAAVAFCLGCLPLSTFVDPYLRALLMLHTYNVCM